MYLLPGKSKEESHPARCGGILKGAAEAARGGRGLQPSLARQAKDVGPQTRQRPDLWADGLTRRAPSSPAGPQREGPVQPAASSRRSPGDRAGTALAQPERRVGEGGRRGRGAGSQGCLSSSLRRAVQTNFPQRPRPWPSPGFPRVGESLAFSPAPKVNSTATAAAPPTAPR